MGSRCAKPIGERLARDSESKPSSNRSLRIHRQIQRCFPFEAARLFNGFHELGVKLSTLGVNVATINLKIACIKMASRALLLTSNRRDFEKVPGLKEEKTLALEVEQVSILRQANVVYIDRKLSPLCTSQLYIKSILLIAAVSRAVKIILIAKIRCLSQNSR